IGFDNNNYMFVTQGSWLASGLGGLAGADQKCHDAAVAAAPPHPPNYKDHLSTATENPADPGRGASINSPHGWIRVEGKPFADQIAAGQQTWVYYPPKIGEDGAPLMINTMALQNQVANGSNELGQGSGSYCGGAGVEWTTTGTMTYGFPTAG